MLRTALMSGQFVGVDSAMSELKVACDLNIPVSYTTTLYQQRNSQRSTSSPRDQSDGSIAAVCSASRLRCGSRL